MSDPIKHSPGPWDSDTVDGTVFDNDGDSVALVYDPRNLDLVAAAPELLAALRTLTDLAYDPNADPRDRADAEINALGAIRKAEGRAAS